MQFLVQNFFGSWVFGGSVCEPGYTVFTEEFLFYSLVYTILWCFRRCFTLETNVCQQSNWEKVINVSNRSVSCRKINEKVHKCFCRGNFSLVSCRGSFLRQGQWRKFNVQRVCLQSFKGRDCFVPGFFSERKSLNDDGQTFFFPKVFP